ncbi:MAG: IPT/TIG domain-containing protein [Vicinamibacteria bacterium]
MTNANHPSVVIVGGVQDGTVLSVDEVLSDFSIGSDGGCNLVIYGEAISPLHATVFLDDEGRVTLSDTKSLAGVYVNGTRVTEHVLIDGDEISIGEPGDPTGATLRFAASGSDAPLVDLFAEIPADMTGMGDAGLIDVTAPEADLGLTLEPLPEPSFLAEAEAPMFDAPALEFAPDEAAMPQFNELPAFDEVAPSPMDDFPPIEMIAESEPEPLPEPEPVPAVPAPAPAVAKPKAPPAFGLSSTPAAPRKTPSQRISTEGSDDPLAGLAESLGSTGRERTVLPSAVAAPLPARKTKAGTTLGIKVARVTAVAIVLIAGAFYAYRKYTESIVVPVVDSYLPNPAEPGQTVTIVGSGFGASTDVNSVKVMIGSAEAHVLDVNSTRINLTVPDALAVNGSQTLPLKVTAGGTTSTGRLLKVAVVPKIISLTPRVGLRGDEVTIAGKWLGTPKTQPVVTVAGAESEMLEATPSSIRFKIPEVAATEGQRVSVKVTVGTDVSKEVLLNYGRLPFLESVAPARALPGEVITLAGLGLTAPDLAVSVSGRSAVILSSTDTEIKVSLPGLRLSESAGARDLVVSGNQKTSMSRPVEVLRESATMYSPRFFAEIMANGRVSVSCELGPLMVLGTDAKSRTRAHEAAAKLNALAAQARTTRVQFVAGDVVISAAGQSILTVTAGDGSGGVRGLADVWSAELTDMFDMFFQGRRPARTVEISPDGKAFLDIFAAARRRTSDPGVPQALLSSPDPAWTRSMMMLASSPSLGGGQALSLLDGRWSGVIEVPGAIQPEKIDISLTNTSTGLVGQKTSRQGRLSSDTTLTNVNYNRRELRFSFVDNGQTMNYQGRLDGDTIEGTVTKSSGARVGKLTFKLMR